MKTLPLFYVFMAACVLCATILFVLLRSRIAQVIVDNPSRPNTLHSQLTPRIGGVAIGLTVLAAAVFMTASPHLSLIGATTLSLALVSLWDDRFGLSPAIRFPVHLFAALLIATSWFQYDVSVGFSLEALSLPMTMGLLVLAITWMTNLYNFMDGADGLAGGMAIIGFGCYALAAATVTASGDSPASNLAGASAVISGAALGFLPFNFPPAKVFMGDAGSIPLGFLAAVLGIEGILGNIWPWWFPILVFSPFIADASLTLLKRMLKRERIWQGHRQHYYQRLILSGWSHRRTTLAYYSVMLASALTALALQNEHTLPIGALMWVIIYALLFGGLEWYWRRQGKNNKA